MVPVHLIPHSRATVTKVSCNSVASVVVVVVVVAFVVIVAADDDVVINFIVILSWQDSWETFVNTKNNPALLFHAKTVDVVVLLEEVTSACAIQISLDRTVVWYIYQRNIFVFIFHIYKY